MSSPKPRTAVSSRAGDAQTAAEAALVALVAGHRVRLLPAVRGLVVVPDARPGRAVVAPAGHPVPAPGARAGRFVAGVTGRPGPVHQPRLLPRLERVRPAHPGQWHADDRRPGVGLARLRHRHRPRRPPHGIRARRRRRALAVGVPRRRLRASGPAPAPRCWWPPASCSCSARPWPPTASGCCRRRLWLGCRRLAYVLHRSMLQEDGSGWLTSHRRGTSRRRRGCGVVLGVSAIAIGLLVGPACCPAPVPTPLHQHPQPPVRLAPDDQPAGRHPGPHRQPERHRAVHVKSPDAGVLAADGARRVRRAHLVVGTDLQRRPRAPRRRPRGAVHDPRRRRTYTIAGLDSIW